MPVLEITYLEIIVLEIRDPAQSTPVLEIAILPVLEINACPRDQCLS
jgi:hypothetical protein